MILGFVHDDPRSPVVLGMLHSSQNPAPFEAASDNNEKGFVSRNGIQLVFHEEQGSLHCGHPKGKRLFCPMKNGNILLEDQHGNRIEMNAKGIALKKDIKADAQSNCTLSAKQQLKAESKGNAQFKAGAIAEIKGSIVNIN